MELILIRHLPTEHNRKGWLQGRLDTDIIPPGPEEVRGIEANRRRIQASGPLDRVLSSRLRRTIATARHYGFEAACEVEPLLDELDFGPFEGLPREHMLDQVGEIWVQDPGALVFGEPLSGLARRVTEFVAKYRDSSRILVFGHGAWIRALLSLAESGDLRRMNRIEVAGNSLRRVRLDHPAGAPPWGPAASTDQKL